MRPARRWRRPLAALLLAGAAQLLPCPPHAAGPQALEIPEETALALGHRIWHNEGRGRVDLLTWWNEHEDFASLGIGHFIWYPAGRSGPFRERFPELIDHLAANGVAIPAWLDEARTRGCPWPNRAAFLASLDSPALQELRGLLADTVALQARFIAAELTPARARILASVPAAHRAHAEARLIELARSEQGLYALVDYLNFKGDGTDPRERYQETGWGLAQVLQEMLPGSPHSAAARFAAAAARVLRRRVRLSPPARGEARWLPGWERRLATYSER